jgi:phosphatidylserine/phosphatidylglycerophosphate/cardiolipin synthase-like enzyme
MKKYSPYLLAPEDAKPPAEPYPATFTGSRVTPLVDPPAFFRALAEALDRTGETPEAEFIYLAGHVINLIPPGDPLCLPGKNGSRRMLDVLIEKARQGVDVRVLPWISWSLAKAGRLHAVPESADNIRTVLRLRQEPELENKACLNVIGHPAGAVHSKLIIIGGKGWAVGFTGGIDLSPDRCSPEWLDVQAQVEGPAVQGMYDYFCQMWEQNLVLGAESKNGSNGHSLSSLLQGKRLTRFESEGHTVQAVPSGAQPTPARRLSYEPIGSHTVQSLRILPRFNFAPSPVMPYVNVAPIVAAPNGVFEVRRALRKAILAARRYIYIEDQYLWSQEAMSWINQALRHNPDLRVMLVTGESKQLRDRLHLYRALAVLDGLLPGLEPADRRRVRMYQSKCMIHAKTVLIDDAWAMIGSANLARRSFYTDVEHAISVVDSSGEFGRSYRVRLWSARLGIAPADGTHLADLEQALSLWDVEWGSPWKGRTPVFPFRPLPLDPPPERPEIDEEWYAMVDDPDSRRPWRLPLRTEYPEL